MYRILRGAQYRAHVCAKRVPSWQGYITPDLVVVRDQYLSEYARNTGIILRGPTMDECPHKWEDENILITELIVVK